MCKSDPDATADFKLPDKATERYGSAPMGMTGAASQIIDNQKQRPVAIVRTTDANLIVTAVNQHDALVGLVGECEGPLTAYQNGLKYALGRDPDNEKNKQELKQVCALLSRIKEVGK